MRQSYVFDVFYGVFFFSSRRRHTRCALVTGVQTCALPISSMPIMAARVYHDGKLVRDLGPDEAIPEDCDNGDFFWLGLYEPTPAELAGIARRSGLHPLAVEDALKANQLPKVETYGDQLFEIGRAHV